MAKAGGSAAINGMLYQILGCVGESMTLTLNTTEKGESIKSSYLIIEPSGGGGDLQIHKEQKRIIQQWKAKSTGGTWSLNSVIKDVFPDLYKAVLDPMLSDHSEYVFVTEGRIGRWKKDYELFQKLEHDVPENITLELENNILLSDIFQKIYDSIISTPSIANEDKDIIYKKIWRLLANFHFQTLLFEELKNKVNLIIQEKVETIEKADDVRRALCQVVMEHSAKGDINITPEKILQVAGLTAKSFRSDWDSIKTILDKKLHSNLKDLAKYNKKHDVKSIPEWSDDKDILILYGESGLGKTWRLASLALAHIKNNPLVIFVRSQGDVNKTKQEVANIIWLEGKGHEAEKSLSIVSRRYLKTSGRPKYWLTLFVDDVQTRKELLELCDTDWKSLGIRLAITTPTFLKKDIEDEKQHITHFSKVSGFTRRELRQYLAHHEHSWSALPSDIREILQTPLFAKIFTELSEENGWNPENEYSLFKQYWNRLSNSDHLDERDNFIQLIGDLIENNSTTYPWTSRLVRRAGINSEQQKWLERKGWLHSLPQNKIEVWHDRLFNWAIAETLIEYRKSGDISREQLGEYIGNFFKHDFPWKDKSKHLANKRLGYIPMDVLWLASKDDDLKDEVHHYIQALEEADSWEAISNLYKNLLPTAGAIIVKPIIQRLLSFDKDCSNVDRLDISSCLIEIGKHSRQAVTDQIVPLLDDDNIEIKSFAIRVLGDIPCSDALNKLWILLKHEESYKNEKDCNQSRVISSLTKAIQTSVSHDLKWLKITILKASRDDPVWYLAYNLANIEGGRGKEIWGKVKPTLFKLIPREKHRSLISCIDTFNDKSEIKFLENSLNNDIDLTSSNAFNVLSRFVPNKAVQWISRNKHTSLHLYPYREHWLPYIILEKSKELFSAITKIGSPIENFRNTKDWFQNNENEIETKTLRLIIETVEKNSEKNINVLYPFVEYCKKINKADLIDIFPQYAGKKIEDVLLKLAFDEMDVNVRGHSHYLDLLQNILLKIGGNGFCLLVKDELKHKKASILQTGLKWASLCKTEEIKPLLRKISLLPQDGKDLFEQVLATKNLAYHNDSMGVIKAISQSGQCIAENNLTKINYPPFTDEQLSKPLKIIADNDVKHLSNALFILAISHRKDLECFILSALEKNEDNTKILFSCTYALYKTGCKTADSIIALSKQLKIDKNRSYALPALMNIRTNEALIKVLDYIDSLELSEKQNHEIIDALLFLSSCLPENKRINDIAHEIITQEQNYFSFLPSALFKLVSDKVSTKTQDQLWERVFSDPSGMRIVGKSSEAVKSLAEIDQNDGFTAAREKIAQKGQDRENMPRLLIKLNPQKAISILCKQAIREWETLCLWEIGRSLRYTDKKETQKYLLSMLDSNNPNERIAGVRLCGWQSHNFSQKKLIQLAISDDYRKVRASSLRAIKRQKIEVNVMNLIAGFDSKNGLQRWAYLDAILNTGDPFLLGNKKDVLWLGNILKEGCYEFCEYADKRTKEQKKKLEDDAKKKDSMKVIR